MALIKISNLNADLSASESFLTELQPTDSSQIFGGTSYGYGYKKKGDDDNDDDDDDNDDNKKGYKYSNDDDNKKGYKYSKGGYGSYQRHYRRSFCH